MVSWSGCFLCYDPCKMNQLDDITHLVNIVGFLHFVVVYCAQDLVQERTYSDFRSEHVDARCCPRKWDFLHPTVTRFKMLPSFLGIYRDQQPTLCMALSGVFRHLSHSQYDSPPSISSAFSAFLMTANIVIG